MDLEVFLKERIPCCASAHPEWIVNTNYNDLMYNEVVKIGPVDKEYYNTAPAGIRMSIMMNPVLGKEFFELASLTVSAINGCEMCVTSHEQSVKNHGATEARILDAVRLTAIFKSLIVLL